MKEIEQYIDHTLLKPTAVEKDILRICDEAIKENFYAVCIPGCFVKAASSYLKKSRVKVATVVGFPLGFSSIKSKVQEATLYTNDGADEIDMVINIGHVKSEHYDQIKAEVAQIKEAIGTSILKVIIETCYLTNQEKVTLCKHLVKTKADFIKTSTGYGTGGATIEDIKLIKSVIGNSKKIKASGGIKDYNTAKLYIDHGVERIGTSSALDIVKQARL
ncbi:deoxyribose-phosphate aldolase [Spongiivirga sp. MCCC 1A20706]|uniref:deoxyribose-phosphate aldolase n=1 Tax=Spongiivirga sp. MCCC 1A20706 TaxID=3160963 RepID=UPI0039778281